VADLTLQIEQWYEHNYPTFVRIIDANSGPRLEIDGSDARAKIYCLERVRDQQLVLRKKELDGGSSNGSTNGVNGMHASCPILRRIVSNHYEFSRYRSRQKRGDLHQGDHRVPRRCYGVILAFCGTVIYVIIKYMGETSPGYTRGAAKAISSTL
jgi:farnesyl-diphosphate farnesyltransferase